jgi:hypothetical protein
MSLPKAQTARFLFNKTLASYDARTSYNHYKNASILFLTWEDDDIPTEVRNL